ncbi:MAG: hypothetical protein SOZ60_05630 [Prevotella sp.]|nr:hypothetical protein [Bacteroidales bacterium]MDY3876878.1 hypothetical protein [Prevotella sp.]
MSRITIATKKTGDRLTATEFNAVVDAVNDNATDISTLQAGQSNMGKVVSSVQVEQNTQRQSISNLQDETKVLKAGAVKMVTLTQDEYEALGENVDADTYYNILEE